jgi:hypothetical protein
MWEFGDGSNLNDVIQQAAWSSLNWANIGALITPAELLACALIAKSDIFQSN